MKEATIEQRLTRNVQAWGGLALKLVSPGFAGVPDRLVLLPRAQIAFVELKAPGKKLRALQRKRKKQIETLGFRVYTVDSYQKIDLLLQEMVL